MRELLSRVQHELVKPAIDPVFHQPATCTGCTDVTAATCSCTVAGTYYTSTTWMEPVEDNAVWFVGFSVGLADLENKHVVNSLKVRAVRGGR